MVSAMISKGAGAALGATGLAATGQAATASRALFAEIYNPCTFTQVSLVYRTALGTTDMLLAQLSDSISPNAYRLFAGPQYTSGGTVDGTFTTRGRAWRWRRLPDVELGHAARQRRAGRHDKRLDEGLLLGAITLGSMLGGAHARIPNGHDTNSNVADLALPLMRTPHAARRISR